MSVQRTLTGDEADADARQASPATFLACPECGDRILRSRRDDHPHDLSDATDVTTAKEQQLDEKVPDEARVETQTYRVEFTDEYTEIVTVEAANEHEAKEIAENERTYSGEFTMTLHTRTEAWGEPSAATLDYLERYNLLPDDHDVTQGDIERVIDS